MLLRRLCAVLAALLVAGLVPVPSGRCRRAVVERPLSGGQLRVPEERHQLAARQPEGDLTAVYTLRHDLPVDLCGDVVDGPAPSNPTIPQPQRYTWTGEKWSFSYNWQWECFRGDGLPRVYSPAQSWVTYTRNRTDRCRAAGTPTSSVGRAAAMC
jgi:hypothetical protein